MTTEEMIQWIDKAGYYELLEKWRFAEVGDPFFQDEVGMHYKKVMCERRNSMDPSEAVSVSKAVGWDK